MEKKYSHNACTKEKDENIPETTPVFFKRPPPQPYNKEGGEEIRLRYTVQETDLHMSQRLRPRFVMRFSPCQGKNRSKS
ncbi:hypothetical protein CDAR_575821 [Caerostris darwini]|uniref:Transformer n=1 Tax=Caerostris darwini TaxID=1538125 RepID=A0AAV4XA99_9ARAC|nr:hypothetical protein CDAR_575821 [Caerostris darwini]